MLPGAKIIHCVRDPRDIGLSIFTFRFHGEHGYAHDLADLGWTIGQQERLMAHWKAVLPNPVLTVKLAIGSRISTRRWRACWRMWTCRTDPACARFYEADSRVRTVSRAQVRQPVNARGLGRWRAYAEDLQPMIAELSMPGRWRGIRLRRPRPADPYEIECKGLEMTTYTVTSEKQLNAEIVQAH